MPIHLLDVYRTANIGIFLKSNDRFLLVPQGLAETKVQKLAALLELQPVPISVAGSRLLGPLTAMNDHGILVSWLAEDEEVEALRTATGLRVERGLGRHTCVGNLIACNDRGAVASPLLTGAALDQVRAVLEVSVEPLTIATYNQVGAMVAPTNVGAIVHPRTTELELTRLEALLQVHIEPATVNGGVPYVASGIVANARNAVVGNLTTGPELLMLSRALGF